MPNAYKVLGQLSPADTNNSDLYTVPNSTSTVVSTLLATNTSSLPKKCRIFIRVNEAAAAKNNALIYDGIISANDFKAMTVGITLGTGDVITVQSESANDITFHAFGSEVAS